MLQAGDRISDWIVEAPLGAGGMGTVFRCRNALADRIRAAVKVLRPDGHEDFRERFIREVEALETLQHPAIVRVKGWGETEDHQLWLAMDLVEGAELGERISQGPMGIEEATPLFSDLAAGLCHAHHRNVFHRDIKPANILLQPDGRARLVDFGIAMQGGRTRLSTAGIIPGTPAYLAPEVFGGAPHPQLLDIYALGQVLHESLTGALAFAQPSGLTTTQRIAHVAGAKLTSTPMDPGEAAGDVLRQLVRRATDPDPRRRLQDMEAFAAALEGELLPDPPTASATLNFELDGNLVPPALSPPPPEPPRLLEPPRPIRVSPAIIAMVLVGLGLGVAAGALGATWMARPTVEAPNSLLTGMRVRLIHRTQDLKTANRVKARLRAEGATVEIMEQRSTPDDYFGKVIYWEPTLEPGANAVHEILIGMDTYSKVRLAPETTTEPLDFAVWLRTPD